VVSHALLTFLCVSLSGGEQERDAYNERMGLARSERQKDRDPSAFTRRVKSADDVAIDRGRESLSKVDFERAKKNGREDASALLAAERGKFQARMDAKRRGSHTGSGEAAAAPLPPAYEEQKDEAAQSEEEEEEEEEGDEGDEVSEYTDSAGGDESDALGGVEEGEEGEEEEA